VTGTPARRPWRIHFFQRAPVDDAGESVPKIEFLDGLPLSLDPPVRCGWRGWRVHREGLLTWENAVVFDGDSGHVRRHFL
jgi:hypothetical protein